MISLYIKRLSFGQVLSSFLLLFLVLLWIVPTVGLFVSSFRDKDQLAITGSVSYTHLTLPTTPYV